jgi:hypothetical protein
MGVAQMSVWKDYTKAVAHLGSPRLSTSTMSLSAEIITELSCGDARPFANWPDPAVPTFGAGVYTIWHKDGRLIYVGMSGRGITAGTIQRNTPQGIYTRLHSHASGRRSGDQFCVYVADSACLADVMPRRHRGHRVGASPNGCVRAQVHPMRTSASGS